MNTSGHSWKRHTQSSTWDYYKTNLEVYWMRQMQKMGQKSLAIGIMSYLTAGVAPRLAWAMDKEGQSIVHKQCLPPELHCQFKPGATPAWQPLWVESQHQNDMDGTRDCFYLEQWHQNYQVGLLIATLTWQPWLLGTPPEVCWRWVVLAAQIAGWLPVWTQGHQLLPVHWYHSGTPSTEEGILISISIWNGLSFDLALLDMSYSKVVFVGQPTENSCNRLSLFFFYCGASK